MNARYTSRLVGVAFVALSAVAASNWEDQRAPECTVAPFANFNTRLVEVGSGSGDCAEVAAPAVIRDDPATPAVEGNTVEEENQIAAANFINGLKAPLRLAVYGLRPYVVLGSDGYADFDIPQNVAIQDQALGDLRQVAISRAEGYVINDPPLYAFGQFATPTPQGDICTAPSFASGRLVIPELAEIPAVPDDPETEEDDSEPRVPPQPAVDIEMAWSDVRVLVTAGYPGVQFQGTVRYTVNSCTRTYTATGVFGGNTTFGCEGTDPNPDPDGDPIPNGTPDPSQCDPLITGVNPDFPVVCDPVLLTCLLPEGRFPATP